MILTVQTDRFSENAKILAIGIKTYSSIKTWNNWEYASEEEMLSNFINYFLSKDDKIIIGFNVMKFDIPLLLLKSVNLQTFSGFFKKINFSNIVDLFMILTFTEKGEIKGLNCYLEKYKIPSAVSDREMLKLYERKEYRKFEDAFERKLQSIDELFLRLWKKVKVDDRDVF
ncbi:MAG: hypothetical protein DRP16_04970 [Candidatus Aenigmatarchaeota archaeon]|nr:MAG: hypothetical protein DRP16_04970 [Candidatus Aenigmarchaeota archaeon]